MRIIKNMSNNNGVGIIKIIVIIIIIGAIIYGLGYYRIDRGQGVILTETDGNKVGMTDYGWHHRWLGLTSVEEHSMVNNRLYFPMDLPDLEQKFQGDKQTGSIGYDIKTSDNKIVDTGGMVQFTIVDLFQFGVMNTNPMEQLQKTVDGEFFKILQSKNFSSDVIINDQGVVEDAILRGLQSSGIQEQYGVRFTKVQLIRPTYTRDALNALSVKQATISLAEGELAAAELKANATRTIAKAENYKADLLKDYKPWVLTHISEIELWKVLDDKDRKDATVIVVQPGANGGANGGTFVLPQPKVNNS